MHAIIFIFICRFLLFFRHSSVKKSSPSMESKTSNLQRIAVCSGYELVLVSFVFSRCTRRNRKEIEDFVSRSSVARHNRTKYTAYTYLLFWYFVRLQNETRYAVSRKVFWNLVITKMVRTNNQTVWDLPYNHRALKLGINPDIHHEMHKLRIGRYTEEKAS